MLVINPMLTGALHLCGPQERVVHRTFLTLELENGRPLDEEGALRFAERWPRIGR